MQQSHRKFKRLLFLSKPVFNGIPTPIQFINYNYAYYDSVKELTAEFYGPTATIANAVETMNLHGNMVFFNWFPDLYQTDKAILKNFCNPVFTPVGGNEFADYLHGLTHIRSLSSHTNLGEALAVIDNMINNKVRYQRFMNKYKDTPLQSIDLKPADLLSDLGRSQVLDDNKKIVLFDIIKETWAYQRRDMVFYERTYQDGAFKQEFPAERPSNDFLRNPVNDFEQRMQKNFIRALFLDEKFKLYSSHKQYFSNTPINISHAEPCQLVFTNSNENNLIDAIVDQINLKSTSIKVDWTQFNLDRLLVQNTIEKTNEWLPNFFS